MSTRKETKAAIRKERKTILDAMQEEYGDILGLVNSNKFATMSMNAKWLGQPENRTALGGRSLMACLFHLTDIPREEWKDYEVAFVERLKKCMDETTEKEMRDGMHQIVRDIWYHPMTDPAIENQTELGLYGYRAIVKSIGGHLDLDDMDMSYLEGVRDTLDRIDPHIEFMYLPAVEDGLESPYKPVKKLMRD